MFSDFLYTSREYRKFGGSFVLFWRLSIDSVWNYIENQRLVSPSTCAWISLLAGRNCCLKNIKQANTYTEFVQFEYNSFSIP